MEKDTVYSLDRKLRPTRSMYSTPLNLSQKSTTILEITDLNENEPELEKVRALPWRLSFTSDDGTTDGEVDEESSIYKTAGDTEEGINFRVEKLLQHSYPGLEISSKGIHTINTFMDNFAVSLLEDLANSVSENPERIHSKQVIKSLRKMMAVPTTEISPENSLKLPEVSKNERISGYFATIDKVIIDIESLFHLPDGWIFDKEKEGVKIYKKDMPDNRIQMMKGVGIINASVEKVKNAVLDFANMNKWDPLFETAKELEALDNRTAVFQFKYMAKACILKRARDFVCITHWYQKTDGSYTMVGRSVEHPNCLPNVNGPYLRGEILSIGYIIAPKNGDLNVSELTYISHLDVKVINENLRATFFSIVQEKQPLNISGLRKYITGKK